MTMADLPGYSGTGRTLQNCHEFDLDGLASITPHCQPLDVGHSRKVDLIGISFVAEAFQKKTEN